MDKQLNLLDIELAGIREKVKTAEIYKEKETMGSSTYAKLNEMYVELMVELSGLQARSEETEKIRQRERKFLSAYANLTDLHSKTNSIRGTVRQLPNVILDISNRLKDPIPRTDAYWLPPNVYRDTVIIHPVDNR